MSESDNSRQSVKSLSVELFEFCRSELLSEDGLREIFERYELTPNNNNVCDHTNFPFFHCVCANERVTERIIQFVLEYFPADLISASSSGGWTPLLLACCYNPNVSLDILKTLIDAAPTSVGSVSPDGQMPLHYICSNKMADEKAATEMLEFLLQKHPEAVRHSNDGGCLPIHIAADSKSAKFCKILIEEYPGSEQMGDAHGNELPLHLACRRNGVTSVEYLYKLCPDAINHSTRDGFYPIHCAMSGVIDREDPVPAAEIVKFLLNCDPNVAQQKLQGETLLHIACLVEYNDSNIETAIEVINAIYELHPEAIEDDKITSNIQECHQQVQAFLNTQLDYARQANDHRQMTTPDGNGQLPLHRALQNNARLGSIKLLVRGNPHALQSPDNSGVLPLHIACQHHDSADVVRYLIGLDTIALSTVDSDGNAALHHACRGAKYDTIATLLEYYDAVSVSRQNAHGKLPVELLWKSDDVDDRDGLEYVESIFRLLKAYPETVMTAIMKEQGKADDCFA